MATNHYRMKTGASSTNNGRDLLDTLAQISDGFARLQTLFDAMTQARDGNTGTSTDYITPANLFGFIDTTTGQESPTVAQSAYDELNSFIGNGGPSLKQVAARLRQ